MQSSITRQNWKVCHTKISYGLEVATFTISAITMLVAMFDNTLSMKLFNISGVLALLALILRGKSGVYSWQAMLLPASILFIGIIDLIWYELFKTNDSPFKATYHSYINTAKIFIFGAFIVLLSATSKIRIKKDLLLSVIYAISFVIFACAVVQKMNVGDERVNFGVGTSTGAAYSIMLVGLLSAASIFYMKKNHPFLFIANAVVILAALVMTQTRSSILTFPVICCLAMATYYSKTPKKLFLGICAFVFLLIAIGLVFSKPIIARYEAAVSDIKLYQQDNSNSSLGARFAMYEVGINLFEEAPLEWRSAEKRAEDTAKMIAVNKTLSPVTDFLNIHLHNEIIENVSLKGLIGAISIIAFYIALLTTVYHCKSLGLFVFTLAIIWTGLSDVIIWSRSIPIIIICGLTVLLLLTKERSKP